MLVKIENSKWSQTFQNARLVVVFFQIRLHTRNKYFTKKNHLLMTIENLQKTDVFGVTETSDENRTVLRQSVGAQFKQSRNFMNTFRIYFSYFSYLPRLYFINIILLRLYYTCFIPMTPTHDVSVLYLGALGTQMYYFYRIFFFFF